MLSNNYVAWSLKTPVLLRGGLTDGVTDDATARASDDAHLL